MGKKSPPTFQKLQRERQKQLKRQEKMERRLDRNESKRMRQSDDSSSPLQDKRDPENSEPTSQSETVT